MEYRVTVKKGKKVIEVHKRFGKGKLLPVASVPFPSKDDQDAIDAAVLFVALHDGTKQ